MIGSVRQLSVEHPFPGLRPFVSADAPFFFGRENQVSSLYRLLDRSRFIAVVGSSGSGKSSLVRAGLLPLLHEESDGEGGRNWRFATFQPGEAPLAALTDAVAELAAERDTDRTDRDIRRSMIDITMRRSSFGLAAAVGDLVDLDRSSVLLVVDQFEELFRYARTASDSSERSIIDSLWREEAAYFVQLLLEATRRRASSVHVMITMRSDFIGDCAQFRGLPEAVSASQFLVPSLSRDQREAVIRQPLVKAGASIESALVERLLNDASDDIDQLPVLQHCLAQLWDEAGADATAAGRRLTLDTYEKIHGIDGALSQHAERILASPELRGLDLVVEQVFRALSEVDKDGRAVRRALTFKQLLAETGADEGELRRAVDRFRAEDCLFIVPPRSVVEVLADDQRVDVVHEALLRRWERISAVRDTSLGKTTGWLDAEERDGRAYRGLLSLLPPPNVERAATLPLDQVQERMAWWKERPRTAAWANRYGGRLERVEQLLRDSVAALELQRKKQREEEKLANEARVERLRADAALRLERRTRRFAAIVAGVALLAIAAAAAAINGNIRANQAFGDANTTALRLQAANMLLKTEQHKTDAIQERLRKFKDAQNAARLARERLAKLAAMNAMVAERQQNALLARANATAIANADTAKKASATANANAKKEKKANVIAQGASRDAQAARADVYVEHGRQALVGGRVDDAALYLTAAYTMGAKGRDFHAMLPEALRMLHVRGPRIARAHSDVRWKSEVDPGSGKYLRKRESIDRPVRFLAFAGPRRFLSAGDDGTVNLWDAATGTRRGSFHADDGAITAAALDPHGHYVAAGWEDGALAFGTLPAASSDGDGPLPMKTIVGQQWRINALAFSSDGKYVASASADGTIVVWDVASRQRLDSWTPSSSAGGSLLYADQIAFANHDAVVVAALRDGELRMRDWRAQKSVQVTGGDPHVATVPSALAVSRDSTVVALGAIDGTVLVYDLAARREVVRRHDATAAINSLAFDAQQHVLAADADGDVRILPRSDDPPVATLPHPGGAAEVLCVATNDRANLIVATYANGTVAFFTAEGQPIAWLGSGSAAKVRSVAFSGNGDTVVTGSDDGHISEWYPGFDRPSAQDVNRGIEALAVNPSGSLALSGERDGKAVLWDLRPSLKKRAVLSSGSDDWITRVEFLSNNVALTMAGDSIRIWSVSAARQSLAQTIRPTAPGRRFTDAAFIKKLDAIFAAQTGADPLNLRPYPNNRWFVWSLAARRALGVEPDSSWDSLPRRILVTPDGANAIIITRADARVHVLDVAHRTEIKRWRDAADAYLPRYHRYYGYAVGGTQGEVLLSSLKQKQLYYQSFDGQGRVSAFGGSDDEQWLGVAHEDTADVVILETGQIGSRMSKAPRNIQHAVLRGHNGAVRHIAFSPGGGEFVVTINDDGTATLWDRDTGAALTSESIPGSKITTVRFMPNGAAVVLGGSDGNVVVRPLVDRELSVSKVARYVIRTSDTTNWTASYHLARLIAQIREAGRERHRSAHRTLSLR